MMKQLLYTLLLFSTILSAQLPKALTHPTPADEMTLYKDYGGSIYLSAGFKKATLIDNESNSYNVKLKYNIYSDQLEYKDGSNLLTITKDPSIYAHIDKDYIYYCNFLTVRGLKKQGYFVLVELNERYRIYKKYELNIIDPVISRDPNIKDIPGRIKRTVTYYLEERKVIMELPMNKEGMLAALKDKEQEISKYIKSQKLKLKNEEDLIQLVSKYNALKNGGSSRSRTLLSNTD